MVSTQLDLPEDLDRRIKVMQSAKDYSDKREAIIEILKEALSGIKMPEEENLKVKTVKP